MHPQFVDAPHLFPGLCIDGRQDPCVNTFYELPGYGQVYISRPMGRDVAREFPGLVDELAGETGRWVLKSEAEAELVELRTRLADAEGELAELAPIIRSLERAQGRKMIAAAEAA